MQNIDLQPINRKTHYQKQATKEWEFNKNKNDDRVTKMHMAIRAGVPSFAILFCDKRDSMCQGRLLCEIIVVAIVLGDVFGCGLV